MHFIIVNAAERQVFQRDVESAFCLSRSTATGILQSMEKNGLILRESVPIDARLKNLIPTEKAVSLDAQIGEYIRDVEQCITHGLTDAQLSMFFETAALMSDNLDA